MKQLSRRTWIITSVVLAGAAAAALLHRVLAPAGEPFRLEPVQRKSVVAATSDALVGTGWSSRERPDEATAEAVAMALGDNGKRSPDFAVIFASSGSNLTAILRKARELLGTKTRIFGGTSDSRAVMTDKGFVRASARGYEYSQMEGRHALAVMTVSSRDITFGVGSADFSACPSPQEGAKAAVLEAIASAGKSPNDRPRLILSMCTIGAEEEALEGIEQVVGKSTPLLGGTTGGPAHAVLGKDRTYAKGTCVAAIYTDLPLGWAFEGGFEVTDVHAGIATKVEGQGIVEIDHRPALEVYDEWLDGKIEKLLREQGNPSDRVRDLLTLHPLYRKYTSPSGQDYFLFSHPWPKDDTLKDKTVMTSTKIRTGERLCLSRGTWDTLINRIGNLPKNARVHGGLAPKEKPLLSISFLCGGVMGTIPEAEREKMPLLVNYANQDAPCIACFTWGEQGHFPGIGNKHGNLLTSFLVVGHRE